MIVKQKDDFLNKVVLQVETNRLMHGDKQLSAQEWAMIAGEHMGHLINAVRVGDMAQVEKEILHITAPLMELHQATVVGKNKERNWKLAYFDCPYFYDWDNRYPCCSLKDKENNANYSSCDGTCEICKQELSKEA